MGFFYPCVESGSRLNLTSFCVQWEPAKHDCDKALELDPSNVKAAYYGAKAALQLGDALEHKRLLGLALPLAEAAKYPADFIADIRTALSSAP